MAYSYTGGNYIEIPNNTAITGVQAGAVAFLMKTTQATANVVITGKTGSSASAGGPNFILNNSAGKLTIQAKSTTGGQRVLFTGTTTVNDGGWHGVIYNWHTVNGNANTLYVDGVQDATGNATADWPLGSDVFRIGRSLDAFWGSYTGEIAEFAWFNRNLTADEIASLTKRFRPMRLKPKIYVPQVRAALDLYGPATTVSGSPTITPHPRVL